MATVFPNTSNFKSTVFTDFTIKPDNDVTLSTIDGGELITSSSDSTFHTKVFKAFTYTGWLQTVNTDDTFKVFHDVPGSGYIQDVSDPGNNVLNIYSGSTAIDRGFIAPYNGLFKFSLREKGYAIGNPVEKKGGFLSFQIVSYPSSSITESTYPGTNKVLYETSPTLLIYTSSRYNYELKTKGNSINSIQYSDTGDFQLSTIGTPLPFNTKTQDNANLFSASFYSVDESSHYLAPVPRSGSYTFDIKVEGSANITTEVTTPSGYQGTFITPNKTITATLILKKRDSGGSFTDEYTEAKDITVGGVSITDPNPGETTFSDISNFDLDSIFDVTDFSIDLDEGESLIAFIKLTTPNGSGTQTFTETIGGIPGFSLQLTNNFFRLNNTSFFKLNSYTPSSENIQYIDYIIEEDNIELPLAKGDAISIFGRVQAIASASEVRYPNSHIEGTTLPGMEISDIYLSTDNFFKCTQGLNNFYNSGQYIGQPKKDGHYHYQPIYGSFYVDLSGINATPSHPVKVQIPLHGIDKYSDLFYINQVSGSLNSPNNRRFLNHSLEINLTTTQNHSTGLFGVDQLFSTNATHECNFFHWGNDISNLTYNSALVTRFDQIGTGFTSEDINSGFSPPDGDIVNISDILEVNFNNGSLFGIYEGGANIDTSDIPEGSLFSPRVVLIKEKNFKTKGKSVIVQPALALYDPDGDGSFGGDAPTGSLTPGLLHINYMANTNWQSGLFWTDRAAVPTYRTIAYPGFKRYEFFHYENKETKLVYDAPPGSPDVIENTTRPIRVTIPMNNGVAVYTQAEAQADVWNDIVENYAPFLNSTNTNDVDYSALDPGVVDGMVSGLLYNPVYIDLDHPDYEDYPPTITPYLDRIRVQGYDNGDPNTGTPLWNTASNSPVNYHSNDINAGNKMGPDTYHNVQNYYTIPETGFYNVTYLFDLIVSSFGGDVAYLSSPTYFAGSRLPNNQAEVMFNKHPIPYDPEVHGTDKLAHYETIGGHSANTMYGVIKRTPNPDYYGAPIIPGDAAGVPRIVATSSLSLVTKLDQIRNVNVFNNTGFTRFSGFIDDFGREQWGTFHLGIGNSSGLEQDAIIEGWANWERDVWDLNSDQLLSLEQIQCILVPDWVYYLNDGSTVLIQVNPLYGELPEVGTGPFGDVPSLTGNVNFSTNYLLPLLDAPLVEDRTGFTSFLGALNQMLEEVQDIQDLQAQAEALQNVDLGPLARYIRQGWSVDTQYNDVGQFIYEMYFGVNEAGEITNLDSTAEGFNNFIGQLNELQLNQTSGGEYYFSVPDDWNGSDFENWVKETSRQVDEGNRVTITFGNLSSTNTDNVFGTSFRGVVNADLRGSVLVNSFNQQWDQLTGGIYAESLGAAVVNDNKNIFFVKGDRVHVEIAVGPIMHENGTLPWFQTNTPSPDLSIVGEYKKIGSVTGCYVLDSSMLGITPISSYDSELTPHLEFIVTNDTNTIVKGTYKHY